MELLGNELESKEGTILASQLAGKIVGIYFRYVVMAGLFTLKRVNFFAVHTGALLADSSLPC